MIFRTKFILASSSQSRYDLLKKNKLSFIRMKPDCNEGVIKKKLLKKKYFPKQISLELARTKAKSISLKKINKLVVGSDTVISINGSLLDKANNIEGAKKSLLRMSNKKHSIYSSATAYYNKKEIWNSTQKTTVKIRKISKKEVDLYLKNVGKKILNSVGCYRLEKEGPNIIENINGDFFNVMGFPLFPFLAFLKTLNIKK
jgi:septum formation protein